MMSKGVRDSMAYFFFKELQISSRCSMSWWDGERGLIMVGFCILSLEFGIIL